VGAIHPAAVRRAIAWLEANAGTPATLADIAVGAGVPERTVHDCLRQFEGVSSMHYLRNLRLDRVRAIDDRGMR
jgi:transcriptional regulator GlxA family with amidase domain